CDRPIPPPSAVSEDYPSELERIVLKALAKDRDERYASARELQNDLEEFVRSERLRVSPLALTEFMQSLFAAKLAAHEEALLAGRRLAADARALEHTEQRVTTRSTPAAVRTIPPGPLSSFGSAGVFLALVIAGAVGSVWWTNQTTASRPALGTALNT